MSDVRDLRLPSTGYDGSEVVVGVWGRKGFCIDKMTRENTLDCDDKLREREPGTANSPPAKKVH